MTKIKYAFVNEEISVKFYREYQKTLLSYVSNSNSLITVNNNDYIQQYPIIKIKFKASATNPTLYFSNGTTQTTITIPGSYVNSDFVVLDSRTKTIKKNNTTLLNLSPTLFPVIEKLKYFKCWISNSIATLELTYIDVEDKPILTKSRDDFNFNWNSGKKIDVGKSYYNADNRKTEIIPSSLITFDCNVTLFDEQFLNIINTTDSFKLEITLDNSDEYNVISRVLCNCVFDLVISSGENSLVKQKINGQGVLLGETPSLHNLFYQSDALQLILTNTTKNLIMEVPFAEITSVKFNVKYRDKKVFRSKPKKILEEFGVNVDLSNVLTDSTLKEWVGDILSCNVNYFNSENSIPLSISDVVIENLSWNSEKDNFVKQQFTLTGNL